MICIAARLRNGVVWYTTHCAAHAHLTDCFWQLQASTLCGSLQVDGSGYIYDYIPYVALERHATKLSEELSEKAKSSLLGYMHVSNTNLELIP